MEADHSDLEVDPNLVVTLQSMRDAAKRVYLATFKIDDVIFCMKTCREALIKKDGAQKENHARMLKRFNKSGEDCEDLDTLPELLSDEEASIRKGMTTYSDSLDNMRRQTQSMATQAGSLNSAADSLTALANTLAETSQIRQLADIMIKINEQEQKIVSLLDSEQQKSQKLAQQQNGSRSVSSILSYVTQGKRATRTSTGTLLRKDYAENLSNDGYVSSGESDLKVAIERSKRDTGPAPDENASSSAWATDMLGAVANTAAGAVKRTVGAMYAKWHSSSDRNDRAGSSSSAISTNPSRSMANLDAQLSRYSEQQEVLSQDAEFDEVVVRSVSAKKASSSGGGGGGGGGGGTGSGGGAGSAPRPGVRRIKMSQEDEEVGDGNRSPVHCKSPAASVMDMCTPEDSRLSAGSAGAGTGKSQSQLGGFLPQTEEGDGPASSQDSNSNYYWKAQPGTAAQAGDFGSGSTKSKERSSVNSKKNLLPFDGRSSASEQESTPVKSRPVAPPEQKREAVPKGTEVTGRGQRLSPPVTSGAAVDDSADAEVSRGKPALRGSVRVASAAVAAPAAAVARLGSGTQSEGSSSGGDSSSDESSTLEDELVVVDKAEMRLNQESYWQSNAQQPPTRSPNFSQFNFSGAASSSSKGNQSAAGGKDNGVESQEWLENRRPHSEAAATPSKAAKPASAAKVPLSTRSAGKFDTAADMPVHLPADDTRAGASTGKGRGKRANEEQGTEPGPSSRAKHRHGEENQTVVDLT